MREVETLAECYNVETGDYRFMPRETVVTAAEHNRNAAAYWYKLYQEQKAKNDELMATIAYLTTQIRRASEGGGMF